MSEDARLTQAAGAWQAPKQQTPEERYDAFNQRVKAYAKAGIGDFDDSMMGTLGRMEKQGDLTPEKVMDIADSMGPALKDTAIGMPAAVAGGVADLGGFATVLGYNLVRKVKGGHGFIMPEDFNDVPFTSDYWGGKAGADTHSGAFMAAGVIVPDMMDLLRSPRLWKAVKTFTNGKPTRVASFDEAKRLDAEGMHPDEIWQKTGFDKGANGKWAFHVSDADAKIKNVTGLVENSKAGVPPIGRTVTVEAPLRELYDHPALFEVFPEIGGHRTRITFTRRADDKYGNPVFRPARYVEDGVESPPYGLFNPDKKFIDVNSPDARSTLAHEVQHAIDHSAGLSHGASAPAFRQSLDQYRAYTILETIAIDPAAASGVRIGQFKKAFRKVYPEAEKDEIDYLARQAMKLKKGGGDPEWLQEQAQYYGSLRDKAGNDTHRWLQAAEMKFSNQELETILKGLSDDQIVDLADTAYLSNVGEARARLVQSMLELTQKDIDELATRPSSFIANLSEEAATAISPSLEGTLRPMQTRVPEEKLHEVGVPR